METYLDYVHTKKLNIDIEGIKEACEAVDWYLNEFLVEEGGTDGHNTLHYKLFDKYNLLTFPFYTFHHLYHEIREMWLEVLEKDGVHQYPSYIQCWMNVYGKNQKIDWHSHSDAVVEERQPEGLHYHGFFVVNPTSVETGTLYQMKDTGEEVYIKSEENLMVISQSGRDLHKSTTADWGDEKRITIAFDIQSFNRIQESFNGNLADTNINHWLPI